MGTWGIISSAFTSTSTHATVRVMGGLFTLSGQRITSLHIRVNGSGTGAMAVYFGGTESNPSGATKQAEVINQSISAGWNTFTLASPVDIPQNTIVWIAFKKGSVPNYYSTASGDAEDFYTSHGRHDDGGGDPTISFANTLSAASFGAYRYAAHLTYEAATTYKLDGVTYDKNGTILGSCECYLFKDNQDNTLTFVDYVLSNASTGAYSFTGLSDNDAQYIVVAWKDNTPHVFDVTDHVLQPVVE